ncbi:MAG: laccase domain-containing protein, partial [Deltaproteobacteria bacterium]|nr:laccase domain-containing protein [Deltaproteobacteria bacterium]
MIKKKIGNGTFLFFPNFLNYKELIHAISTRHSGVSSNNYASLNLSFQVGDEDDNVKENHQILSQTLGFDLSSLA